MPVDAAVAGSVIAPLLAGAVAVVPTLFAGRREQKQNDIQIAEVSGVINQFALSGPEATARNISGAITGPQAAEHAPLDQRLLNAIAARAAARFKIQEAHYANALRQSTTYFYASLIVGVVGFAILLTGAGLALSHSIEVGIVTTVGGVLTDGAAVLVFNQSNRAKSDAQTNLVGIAQAAEKDENQIMAFIYASRIQDASVRDNVSATIARSLIYSARVVGHVPRDGSAGDSFVRTDDSPVGPVDSSKGT